MSDFHPNYDDCCCHHDDHIHHHCEDHGAPDCSGQLPMIANVGRGIKGDGFYVRITDPDTTNETYLEGLSYDNATHEWHSEWISENINGGELRYQYNLRPFTDPTTFTITFIYKRPNRPEWSWTTPAIPYIWTIDDDGNRTDPDAFVGSGVATIFVRASKSDPWNVSKHERLHYPQGTTRDDFNAPLPEKAWSATITFGYGGDVELPNFDDLAKILGITKGDIFNILQDNTFTIDGITAKNIIDYINKCDKRDRDHFHKDLGFPDAMNDNHSDKGAFGGEDTVKIYIDKKFGNIYNILQDLIDHIYGATLSVVDASDAPSSTLPDGKGLKITWNPDQKIPQGNLNVYGGDSRGKWIKTHENETNDDVWAR